MKSRHKTCSETPPPRSSSASNRSNYHFNGLAETQSDEDILGGLASEERVVTSLLADPEATPTRKPDRSLAASDSRDSMDYLGEAGNLLQPPLPGSSPQNSPCQRPSSPQSDRAPYGGSSPRPESQDLPQRYGPYDESIDYDGHGHGQPSDDIDPYADVQLLSMSTPDKSFAGNKSVSSMGDLDDEQSLDLPPRTPRSLFQHYRSHEDQMRNEEFTQVSDVPTQIVDAPSQLPAPHSYLEGIPTQVVDAPSQLGEVSARSMIVSTQQEDVATQIIDAPNQLASDPSHVMDISTQKEDEATQIIDAPSQLASVPSHVMDVSTQLEDVPTQILDAPSRMEIDSRAEMEDVPTQLVDEPTQLILPTNIPQTRRPSSPNLPTNQVDNQRPVRGHRHTTPAYSHPAKNTPRRFSPPASPRPIKDLIPWLKDLPASPSSTAPEASSSQSARSFPSNSTPRPLPAFQASQTEVLPQPVVLPCRGPSDMPLKEPSNRKTPIANPPTSSRKSSATRSVRKRRRSSSTEIVPDSTEEKCSDPASSEVEVPLSNLRLPKGKKAKRLGENNSLKRRKTAVKKEEEEEPESSEDELAKPVSRQQSTKTPKKGTTPKAGTPNTRSCRSASKLVKGLPADARTPNVKPSKDSKRPTTSKQATPTPHRASSSSKHHPIPVTEVFGLWREDGFYYHGLVTEFLEPDRFRILFDDNQTDVVHIDQMRRNELRPKDEVYVDNRSFTVRRIDGDQVYLDSTFGKASSGIGLLRIPSNTIASCWNDRRVDLDQVKPRQALARPRAASLVTTSSKTCPLFQGHGFVITKSVPKSSKRSTAELEELDVETVQRLIRTHGGTVVEDWSSVINFDGQHSSPHCWSLERAQCQWRGGEDKNNKIDKIFLLSNDHCTKPKFLTAIALGVPCVDTEFIRRSVDEGYLREWRDHLLEQGTAVFGDHAPCVTQTVSYNWCMSSGDLLSIMDNIVARMLLSGMRIFCHGSDFVKPSSKGRRDDTTANGSFVMIPPIFAAMGADEVVAARSQADAGHPMSYFDYIVVKSAKDKEKLDEECHGKVVSFGWVKNSLILGRLLPKEYRLIP